MVLHRSFHETWNIPFPKEMVVMNRFTYFRAMGNLVGRDGVAEWEPNIRPDMNDFDRPHSQQMRDQVLQFAVPLMCIGALGE